LIGACAAISASCITQPVDVLKATFFLFGEGQGTKPTWKQVVGHIYKAGGVRGFYNGISATCLRQLLFSGGRFTINDYLQSTVMKGDVGVLGKILCGATAGSLGAILSCPADLVLVRMQTDLKHAPSARRNYKHVFDGLSRIVKEEGISQWYRGVEALVMRGMFVTAGQFTTYDTTKKFLVGRLQWNKDNVGTHLTASTTAGTVSSMIVNPMDVIKSRMMASKKAADSATLKAGEKAPMHYTGNVDCILTLLRTEGPLAFYKGLTPCFCRQCPQVILMWTIFEQYKKAYAYLVPPPKK